MNDYNNFDTPIELRKPREFSDVLNATFAFVRQESIGLGKALLNYAGPFVLLAAISSSLFQNYLYTNLQDSIYGITDYINLFSDNVMLTFFLIIFSVLSRVMIILTVFGYMQLYLERGAGNFTFEEVLPILKERLLEFLGASILLGLLLSAIMIVGGFLLVFLTKSAIFFGFIAGFGLFFLLIYLVVQWSLFFPAKAFENTDFTGSLSRTSFLVKDYWWNTFSVSIVIGIIVVVISYIFVIIQSVISGFSAFHALSDGGISSSQSMFSIVINTLSTFIVTLLSAITFVAYAFQYFNLVERKDGTSLKDRIYSINKEETYEDF